MALGVRENFPQLEGVTTAEEETTTDPQGISSSHIAILY